MRQGAANWRLFACGLTSFPIPISNEFMSACRHYDDLGVRAVGSFSDLVRVSHTQVRLIVSTGCARMFRPPTGFCHVGTKSEYTINFRER